MNQLSSIDYIEFAIAELSEERTLKQLFKQTPSKVKGKAKSVSVKGLTTTKAGKIMFKTSSGKDTYKTWIQPLLKGTDVLNDNVIVWCECPFFKYSLEVSLWKGNASRAVASNKAKPVQTNPSMRKYLCKHLVAVFDHLKKKSK